MRVPAPILARSLVVVVCVASVPTATRAQDADPPPDVAVTGTPPGAAAADAPEWQRLLDEGRRLFSQDADYVQALDRFQRSYRAVATWQALSSMATVYQQQGLYVEAYDAYELLLDRFEAVLGDERAQRAHRRMDDLRARIGVVAIAAGQPGVRVSLDGKAVGRGPLRAEVRTLPGAHTLVATGDGFEPLTRPVQVAAGGRIDVAVALQVSMIRVEHSRVVRPIRIWIPWVTLGAGVALAGAGVALRLDARRDFDDAEAEIRKQWQTEQRPGRLEDSSLFRRGDAKNTAAISLAVGGGAAIITGAVLAILNRPTTRVEVTRVPRVVPLGRGVALEMAW